jgi:hypothetical protein
MLTLPHLAVLDDDSIRQLPTHCICASGRVKRPTRPTRTRRHSRACFQHEVVFNPFPSAGEVDGVCTAPADQASPESARA